MFNLANQRGIVTFDCGAADSRKDAYVIGVTQIAVDRGSAPQLARNTILVVDDDEEIREALRDVLGDEGYYVIPAPNGKVALGLLSSLSRPCGLILDVTMPIMDGVELYHAMKAVPDLSDIPVLFLTSDPFTAPRGVPMVEKSVGLDRLLRTVAELFLPQAGRNSC